MTLENISNIDGLFAVINQCTGNVELISDEGDCINLKSRLAQYMTVAGAFSDGYIRSLRLRVEKDEDKVRMVRIKSIQFLMKMASPSYTSILHLKTSILKLPASFLCVLSEKEAMITLQV